jgi:hypothetical protein
MHAKLQAYYGLVAACPMLQHIPRERPCCKIGTQRFRRTSVHMTLGTFTSWLIRAQGATKAWESFAWMLNVKFKMALSKKAGF